MTIDDMCGISLDTWCTAAIGDTAAAAAGQLATDQGLVVGQAARIRTDTNLGALGNPVGTLDITADNPPPACVVI
jgi:hypothetical protein